MIFRNVIRLMAVNPFVLIKDEKTLQKLKKYCGREFAYNPELGKEDFQPQEGDFVEFPFMLLTASVVASGTWRATDFSNEKILKRSMSMLLGKPALLQHNSNLNIGTISHVEWRKAFIDSEGNQIPAGIMGVYRIDAKANIDLVRALYNDEIQGSSVAVWFDWKPSHEEEFKDKDGNFDEWEFYWKVGTKSKVDGKEITYQVLNIVKYDESSIVAFPADKYAKKLNEKGEPMGITEHHINLKASLKEEDQDILDRFKQSVEEGERKYTVLQNFAGSTLLNLPSDEQMSADENVITLNMFGKNLSLAKTDTLEQSFEHIQDFLLSMEFTSIDEVKALKEQLKESAEAREAAVNQLGERDVKLGQLQATVRESEQDLAKIKEKVDNFLAFLKKELGLTEEHNIELSATNPTLVAMFSQNQQYIDAGKKLIDARRNECVEMYKASVPNPNNAIINTIMKANFDELEGYFEQFGLSLTGKLHPHCEDCGSEKISFLSAKEEEEGSELKTKKKEMTMEELRDLGG